MAFGRGRESERVWIAQFNRSQPFVNLLFP